MEHGNSLPALYYMQIQLINLILKLENKIFCPMCDIVHDNNSWCQANMGEE